MRFPGREYMWRAGVLMWDITSGRDILYGSILLCTRCRFVFPVVALGIMSARLFVGNHARGQPIGHCFPRRLRISTRLYHHAQSGIFLKLPGRGFCMGWWLWMLISLSRRRKTSLMGVIRVVQSHWVSDVITRWASLTRIRSGKYASVGSGPGGDRSCKIRRKPERIVGVLRWAPFLGFVDFASSASGLSAFSICGVERRDRILKLIIIKWDQMGKDGAFHIQSDSYIFSI